MKFTVRLLGSIPVVLSALVISVSAQNSTTPPPAATPATPTASPAPIKVASKTSVGGAKSTAAMPKRALVVPPEKANPVTIPRFDKPPVIDGKLDDEVWQKAAVLKDFYQIQPGDNTPPSKPTEVLIGYDPKFLY